MSMVVRYPSLSFFFFSSRRRHTRSLCDWSSDVCSSDLDGSPPTATITTPTFTPLYSPTPTPKPTPILTARGKSPAISATEAILLDDDTDHILDDLNGESPVPMASTTKIMSALIAIQAADLNKVVTIHQDAINEVMLHNGSSAQLQLGDQLTLHDLLHGLMLPSGDDAAIVIADAVG